MRQDQYCDEIAERMSENGRIIDANYEWASMAIATYLRENSLEIVPSPSTVDYEAEVKKVYQNCRHGIRHPHECRDCIATLDERKYDTAAIEAPQAAPLDEPKHGETGRREWLFCATCSTCTWNMRHQNGDWICSIHELAKASPAAPEAKEGPPVA